MRQKQLETTSYITPWCKVEKLESEEFFCTSVIHQASGSTEEDWDNDQDIDGGEIEF